MYNSKSFKDLNVWQKAHGFVLTVYKVTEQFPKSELYGLTAQFRRSAVSIPANIAEGFTKKGKADKLRFYNISQGSIQECLYYLILSRDLKYIDNYDELTESLNQVAKMLQAYMNTLRNS